MDEFEEQDSEFRLSPEAWNALVQSAAEVCDLLEEDKQILLAGDPNSSTAVVALMPRRFVPRYDLEFVERLSGAAKEMLDRIRMAQHKGWDYPYETFLNSVAEELLMSRIIYLARQRSSRPEVIEQLDEVEEAGFEDRDFELLYDLSHDGITDDSRVAEQLGFANLKFEDWFSPFREEGHLAFDHEST